MRALPARNAAQTVAEDFFGRFDAPARGSSSRWQRVVEYGGRERQDRSRTLVLPCSQIDRFDWAGAGQETEGEGANARRMLTRSANGSRKT